MESCSPVQIDFSSRSARPFGPLRGAAADAARSLIAAARLAWAIEGNWAQPFYLLVYLIVRPLAFLGLFLAVLSIGGSLNPASIGFVVVGQAIFQIVGAAMQGPTHALLDDRERYRTIRYIFATPSSLLPVSIGRALIKALRDEVSLPVHFHTHDTSGVTSASILRAADAGVDIADAAMASMCFGRTKLR